MANCECVHWTPSCKTLLESFALRWNTFHHLIFSSTQISSVLSWVYSTIWSLPCLSTFDPSDSPALVHPSRAEGGSVEARPWCMSGVTAYYLKWTVLVELRWNYWLEINKYMLLHAFFCAMNAKHCISPTVRYHSSSVSIHTHCPMGISGTGFRYIPSSIVNFIQLSDNSKEATLASRGATPMCHTAL